MKGIRKTVVASLAIIAFALVSISTMFAGGSAEVDDVEVIKIGALLPLTGTDAINGTNQRLGHEFAAGKINAAGGIEALGGINVEIVYGDSRGLPEAGNAETERLITEEGVVAIVGAFHSGVTLTATEVAERYEVPFLVSNALSGEIVERGLQYTFKNAVDISLMASDTAEFIADMGSESVAIVVPNITFGAEFNRAWNQELPARGLSVVGEFLYPAGASDMQDVILSLRSADPDVIVTIGNTADATLLIRQMQELGYWPADGIVSAGGGFADATLIENLGVQANGLYLTNDWFPNSAFESAQEINLEFREENGIDMVGNINTTYAGTWILKDAIEIAASSDPRDIAAALRSMSLEEGAWSFMYPAIEFDERGMNMYTSNVIAQIQDGEQIVVWPAEASVADPIWPVPGWDNR